MPLYELSLLITITSVIVGIPIYLFYRKLMTDENSVANYSKKRVFKVTLINLFIMLYITTMISLIFLGLFITNPIFSGTLVFLFIVFALFTGITLYGSGIYITSILLEAYTTQELKEHSGWHKQHTAIHLFHGPISHIFIYSGYILVFFVLSIISIFLSINSSGSSILLFTVLGIIVGIAYAIAQIANGTVIYQFATSSAALLFMCFLTRLTLVRNSLLEFFIYFILIHTLITGLYLLQRKIRGKQIYWYMPVDFFKSK